MNPPGILAWEHTVQWLDFGQHRPVGVAVDSAGEIVFAGNRGVLDGGFSETYPQAIPWMAKYGSDGQACAEYRYPLGLSVVMGPDRSLAPNEKLWFHCEHTSASREDCVAGLELP